MQNTTLHTPTGLAQQFNQAGILGLRDELILERDGKLCANDVEGWILSHPQELQRLVKDAASGIRINPSASKVLHQVVRFRKQWLQ